MVNRPLCSNGNSGKEVEKALSERNLYNKVAIVTGASRGIGKAIALALADAGARVVVVARTVEEGGPLKGSINKTADEIRSRGGQSIPIPANVADEMSIENMVQRTLDEAGHIDILVNNAGTSVTRHFNDINIKQWDTVIKVALRSVVVCSKAVLPSMMAQRYGHIINISSIAAVKISQPLTGLAYDVSKAGINRFTWGLAEEMKEYNIAINAVMPRNTASEGWVMVNPDADKSDWQTPELWGRVVTFIATRDPATFTGRVLATEEVLREMTAAGWNI